MKKITILFVFALITMSMSAQSKLTEWTDSTGWSNGRPTNQDTAVIYGKYVTGTHGKLNVAVACIKDTLVITADSSVHIKDSIIIDKHIHILPRASMVLRSGTDVYGLGSYLIEEIGNGEGYYTYVSIPGGASLIVNPSDSNFSVRPRINVYEGHTAYSWIGESSIDDVEEKWVKLIERSAIESMRGYAVYGIDTIVSKYKHVGAYLPQYPSFLYSALTLRTDFAFRPNNNTSGDYLLTGNPYLCNMNLDVFLNEPTNQDITGTVYLWDGKHAGSNYTTSDYATYTTSGGVKANKGSKKPNGIVNKMQGFFVQFIENPDLHRVRFTFASNTDAESVFFKKSYSRVWLSMETDSDTSLYTETLITLRNDATTEYDYRMDATPISPSEFDLYTISDNKELVINSLPETNTTTVLDIAVRLKSGYHTLKFDEMENVHNMTFILEDTYKNRMVELYDTYTEYSFISDSAGYDSTRFKLHIINTTITSVTEYLNSSQYEVKVVGNEIHAESDVNTTFSLYNTLGQRVYTNNNGTFVNVNSGIYIVEWVNVNGVYTTKVVVK